MSNNKHEITRRDFIRQAACAALELTGTINTMSMLRLTNASVIQGNLYGAADDYKAMVCIFLGGGNDSANMLVPAGTRGESKLRKQYEDLRNEIALPSNGTEGGIHLLDSTALKDKKSKAFDRHYDGTHYPMGVHPQAKPIADMFAKDELAFVCNVGSLLYPIASPEEYSKYSHKHPDNLFAHNAQQVQWQTSIAEEWRGSGWGGRMADLLHAGYNGDASKASMSISLSGVNLFQLGVSPHTATFALKKGGAPPLAGFGKRNKDYGYALSNGSTFDAPKYKDSVEGKSLETIESLMRLTNENLFEDVYAQRLSSSRRVSDVLGKALSNADADKDVDYDAIFKNVENLDLGKQLKTIAKLIASDADIGNRRQIYFAKIGGYDTHGNMLEAHSRLMDELSQSLLAFRNALKKSKKWDKTVAFTASDFGRTLRPNRDGTDHAWGGHAMVMGGPIKGGDLYGHFPPMLAGQNNPNSLDVSDRGRIIPTTSVDQYSAPLAKWFGADSNSLETIFPNLGRFDDPFSSATANLKFL